jgi:Uma2 family endonuclease
MVIQKKLYTIEAFERIAHQPENADRLLELIDGEIIEVAPKLEHGRAGSYLHGILFNYLEDHPIGEVMFEVDHRLPDDDENTRRPDVSFITHERARTLDPKQNIPFMPDLAIEIKSPSNYYTGQEGLREKAAYYLKHGSRLALIVDTDKQRVEMYAKDKPPHILLLEDELDFGDVLPGLKIPVHKIFSTPNSAR